MKLSYFLLLLCFSCNKSNVNENKDVNSVVSPPTEQEEKLDPHKVTVIDLDEYPTNKCEPDMVYVEGKYCTNLKYKCIKKLDRKRCQEFDPTQTKCIGKQIPLAFCIDIEEFYDKKTLMPIHNITWTKAKQLCESEGKRLCDNQEFSLACEGNDRRPYSYGWIRDSEKCNIDISKNLGKVGHLKDHTRPINEFPKCLTPDTKIHNLNGNSSEWVYRVGSRPPFRSGLMGGWWSSGVRAQCNFLVGNHFEEYSSVHLSTRCCKNFIK